MEPRLLDLTESTPSSASVLESVVTLTEQQSRLRLLLPPGKAGRAEAVFHEQSWEAKHYWPEAPGVTIYEFDGPLPAGTITLRIPFVPA